MSDRPQDTRHDGEPEQLPAELEGIHHDLLADSAAWGRGVPAVEPFNRRLRTALWEDEESGQWEQHLAARTGGRDEADHDGLAPLEHASLDGTLRPRTPMEASPSLNMPPRRAFPAVAATLLLIIVSSALFAALGSRRHAHVGDQHPSPLTATAASGCPPDKIVASLPTGTYLSQIAMVSPDEGWAVGWIENLQRGGPIGSLILHYSGCHWAPVSDPLPGWSLQSIWMASPVEGWAVAGSNNVSKLILHYADGHWRPFTIPGDDPTTGAYGDLYMLSANEGWLQVLTNKTTQGQTSMYLLHLHDGVWSRVECPQQACRVVPDAPNDAWAVSSTETTTSLLHYHAGTWTPYPTPPGLSLGIPSLLSPTDGWLVATNYSDGSEVALHFDGQQWKQASVFGDPRLQRADFQILPDDDAWAFVHSGAYHEAGHVTAAYHLIAGHWVSVTWPFAELDGVSGVVKIAPNEYWAIGTYQAQLTGQTFGTGSVAQGVLLHYLNGTWSAYRHK